MPDQWFYSRDGQQHGPLTRAQLKDLANVGQLRPDDLLRAEGMEEWSPASQVLELFGAAPGETPEETYGLESAPGVGAAELRAAARASLPNPYQAPRYRAAPPAAAGGTTATVGFVLGLLSLFGCCLPLIGLPVSVTGLILAIKGRNSEQSGLAIAGIVLNSIGLVLTLISAVLGAYMAATGNHALVNGMMR